MVHKRVAHPSERRTSSNFSTIATKTLNSLQSIMESSSNESRLLLAIQAIEKDSNLSIQIVAKIYNVLETTLRRRRTGKPSRHDIPTNSKKLTNLEEEVIIQHILDLDSQGIPPRKKNVEDMANRLFAARNRGRVGVHWADNFITRQPRISTCKTRRYDNQRAQYEDPEIIQD